MENHYKYICSTCEKEIDADFVESKMLYLCPECGKTEVNKPLTGVLSIVYDYRRLKRIYSKQKMKTLTAGKIWSYPDFWPVDFSKIDKSYFDRLLLPSNQILKYNIDGKELYFQDETRNPTYSFKDRASILVALKAKELGINEITAASTGNAGSSLAGICARIGIKAHIFVPKNIPEAKRIQIQSYGAELYVVDGDYDEAFDLSLEISADKKWYNRNTAYNPLTIEGKKSAAYDIYINTHGKIPKVIFVPVGDGVIISGLHKGFTELKELELIDYLPRLIAVQAEGSSAVVDYLSSKSFIYKPATTLADSISAGAPRNLYMAANSVKESGGIGIKVTDAEILDSQKELANRSGLLVEPSCAAVFAGYKKFKNQLMQNEKVLLLMTGSGLKDFESLKRWNSEVYPKKYDYWKYTLLKDEK